MFCRKCGKEVDENDLFCWNCGAEITKRQSSQSSQIQIQKPASGQNAAFVQEPEAARETASDEPAREAAPVYEATPVQEAAYGKTYRNQKYLFCRFPFKADRKIQYRAVYLSCT